MRMKNSWIMNRDSILDSLTTARATEALGCQNNYPLQWQGNSNISRLAAVAVGEGDTVVPIKSTVTCLCIPKLPIVLFSTVLC